MTVGNRIRTLRKDRNLTQVQLAAEVGWERSTIANIESGGDNPGRELLQALAIHFDVSLDWITSGHGDPKPAKAMDANEAILLSLFREAPLPAREAVITLLKTSQGRKDN